MDMPEFKYYIRIDSKYNIVDFFSDGIREPTESDILINSGSGFQFQLKRTNFDSTFTDDEIAIYSKENGLITTNENRIYLLQFKNNLISKKSDTEIAQESLPTLEEVQNQKLTEINNACTDKIHIGIDVTTSLGVKHFSLKSNDQTQIITLTGELQKAVQGLPSTINITKGVPWHADGEICRFWSVNDWSIIAKTAMDFVYYNTTYCNHLRAYIKRLTDLQEIQAISYGAKLPDDLEANLTLMMGDIVVNETIM